MSTDNEGNCSEMQTAIQVKAYQLFFHKPDALFSNKADFQTNTYLCHFLPLLIKKISKPTWQLFFFKSQRQSIYQIYTNHTFF